MLLATSRHVMGINLPLFSSQTRSEKLSTVTVSGNLYRFSNVTSEISQWKLRWAGTAT
jgi:hypothetical protein